MSALRFRHRHLSTSGYDSICLSCFLTVCSSLVEADLVQGEQKHICRGLGGVGVVWNGKPTLSDGGVPKPTTAAEAKTSSRSGGQAL